MSTMASHGDTDAIVVNDVRSGDSRRFAVLVDRHRAKAMTLAVRIVGDVHEAEEVVQDAFLRAYKSLSSFRGDAKFSTWLYRIVYNLSLTKTRRRRTTEDSLGGDEELDSLAIEETDPSAHEQLEKNQEHEWVVDELQRLPAQFKAALTLFYLEEMSYEEMASIMDLPVGTVKTHLHRGRNLMRKRMLKRWKNEVKVA